MQCPQCNSRSVIIKDGQKKCEAKGCTYIQFHVITYENQNRQFEGEKGTENRFNPVGLTGQNNQRQQPKYEKNAERVSKVIKDLIHTMKLSVDLQDRAMSKLLQILKIKYPQQKNQRNGNNTKQKSNQKITNSDHNIAAFSLWLACCDKKMEFKDVRIANQMRISKSDWNDMRQQLESRLKTIINIPQITPENSIRRICTKRKINSVEFKAMLQMLQRIKGAEIVGGKKTTTIAGFVFWEIMRRSSTYNADGKFNIDEYLTGKSSRRTTKDSQFQYWTQKQIDISVAAIIKFKNEDVGNLLESLIPNFQTRINSHQN